MLPTTPCHPTPMLSIPGASVWPAGRTQGEESQLESVLHLSKQEVDLIYRESNSRKNFSAKLCKQVFTEEERRMSNCHGKRGKTRLDPTRLGVVRAITYKYYPLKQGGLKEEDDWNKECVKAIDEINRRKHGQ